MKFSINSKDFRCYVERLSKVCGNSCLSGLQGLIELESDAEAGLLMLKAGLEPTAAKIVVSEKEVKSLSVEESGILATKYDAISSFFNIPGGITVSTKDRKLEAKGEKRCMKVLFGDAFYKQMNFGDEVCITVDKKEIIESLKRAAIAVDKACTRVQFSGINIDSTKGKIYSCNGSMAIMKDMDWKVDKGIDCVIPEFVVEEFSKLAANNKKEDVRIKSLENHLLFIGEDFTYVVRKVDCGKSLDVEALFNIKSCVNFEVDCKSFTGIVKEYAGNKENYNKAAKAPMCIAKANEKIVTAFSSPSCETLDILEDCVDVDGDIMVGVDAKLLKKALGVFDDGKIEIGYAKKFSPLVFNQGNYSMLLCPMRLDSVIERNLSELVKSA